MTKTPAIVIADQDAIDTFPREVDQLLAAIGHPEALVTDESQVWDFLIHIPVPDNEADKGNRQILARLGELMGRVVDRREYLWRLAQELHARAQPVKIH